MPLPVMSIDDSNLAKAERKIKGILKETQSH
jgi:hypothetical protein